MFSILKSIGVLCLFVVLSLAHERFAPKIGSGVDAVVNAIASM